MPARAPDAVGPRGACRGRAGRLALSVLALFALPQSRAAAQAVPFAPAVQFETRVDALGGPPAAGELGVGANVTSGYYVRIGVDAAAGSAWRNGEAMAAGRVDLVSRFLLDPFKEFRWGPYAGAGLTALWNDGTGWRGRLLVLVGVEGPEHAGWRTSVELGLGGGARLGLVFRRARTNGR